MLLSNTCNSAVRALKTLVFFHFLDWTQVLLFCFEGSEKPSCFQFQHIFAYLFTHFTLWKTSLAAVVESRRAQLR